MQEDDPRNIRREIERVDEEILSALNRRYTLIRRLHASQGPDAAETASPEQAAALIKRMRKLNEGPAPDAVVRALFREIFSGALVMEQPASVAYLGPPNTFTHQAAIEKFGHSVNYDPQKTIPDVFDAVGRENCRYGVVPVENSTEGAVTHTLDMFADSRVKICAEINMSIHHNLLCNCTISELKVVYSHPQVFGQCRRWLQENLHHVDLQEVSSTTQAASRCADEEHAGAIASTIAAERYGLTVAARNIEDMSENTTRFLVFGRHDSEPTGDDKTSIVFALRDRVGALYDCLLPFRNSNINLTMIESRPSRRRSWDYNFFVDFLGHMQQPAIREAVEELGHHCQFVRVLGSYPRAIIESE